MSSLSEAAFRHMQECSYCKTLVRHPRPWSIYDPNGERTYRGREGYRPIWLHDANGQEVCYVGKGKAALDTATFIMNAANN